MRNLPFELFDKPQKSLMKMWPVEGLVPDPDTAFEAARGPCAVTKTAIISVGYGP
jgi:hypothetical protein